MKIRTDIFIHFQGRKDCLGLEEGWTPDISILVSMDSRRKIQFKVISQLLSQIIILLRFLVIIIRKKNNRK